MPTPKKLCLFDSKGSLHAGREDIKADTRFYRKWELCETTNPNRYASEADAIKGADVLLGASTPGPGHHQAGMDQEHDFQGDRFRLREPRSRDLPLCG